MRRSSRFVALLALAMSLLLQTVTVFAAPADWKSVDVTLHTEQQQHILLVSGELPSEVKLPAETELAVPAGMQLSWIGEILGGDPANDPAVEYTKSTSDGVDIYRFTLTKARIAQVEGTIPAVTSFDGTNYTSALKWTAWKAVPEVRISQRLPQAAKITQVAADATMQPGGNGGYSYYSKTVQSPKAGEVIDLSFSYTTPAVGSTPAAGSTSNGGLVPVLIVLVAVVGFGLLFVNLNKKVAAKGVPAEKDGRAPKQVTQATDASSSSSRRPRQEASVDVTPATPSKPKPLIPMLIIIGIFLAGFALAGAKGTSAAVKDGKISRDFGSTSPCQSASAPFTVNQGVDLNKQGDELLKGLEGMEGIGEVTVDLTQSRIDMAWCESYQTERTVREALSKSGLITLGASTATTTSGTTTAPVDTSTQK